MTELMPSTLSQAEAAPALTLSPEKQSLAEFINSQEAFQGSQEEWKKSDSKFSTNPPRPDNSSLKIESLSDSEAAELLQLFHLRKQLHEQKSRMSKDQNLRFNILANKIAYYEKKKRDKSESIPPSKKGGIEKKKKEKKRGRAPKKFELDEDFSVQVVDSKGNVKLVIRKPVKQESESDE